MRKAAAAAAAGRFPEGVAVVYCEGAFGSPPGKTAHGLVRRTARYQVLAVVDSEYAGRDAGEVLDCRPAHIPIVESIPAALERAAPGRPATHLVIGLAPDGGRLPPPVRHDIQQAIRLGLNVDCGLHDFLSEDAEISQLARRVGVQLRDIRKPPPRAELHSFSGKIEQVSALKIAVLGTDSAVGKRTTAWLLADEFNRRGQAAELVGTGQTAWLQGVRQGIVLDSLVNDFVAGELEHAVWSAWVETGPEVILIEGQGSLMNPAYPGGYEILAAARPDVVVLQHAPNRLEYDGFPGYKLDPIEIQIQAIELISGRPVVAVTINPEGLSAADTAMACARLEMELALPVSDVLRDGAGRIVEAIVGMSDPRTNSILLPGAVGQRRIG
jgi:uncharacterized NAD-dependent epimerase/dehydratase family protein